MISYRIFYFLEIEIAEATAFSKERGGTFHASAKKKIILKLLSSVWSLLNYKRPEFIIILNYNQSYGDKQQISYEGENGFFSRKSYDFRILSLFSICLACSIIV